METDFLTSAYMEVRDRLHRFAMRMLRDDEDAADALQDAYLRLRTRGEVSSDMEARNKLAAVLRNLCIDRLRQRRSVRLDHQAATDEPSYEMPGSDTDTLDRLLRTGLTPSQLRIMALVVDEGLEYAEAAERLGMTVEAVRMGMSRARNRIRENYKKLNR
ncbi:MAG: sigma-70 family RNA polymerase sigma factor [Muribaculaceae bacterium]|nr:sigma-70 family RNA polymerase sigma factor [Muribaculaceae bacterium]MDE7142321.1 sigma-70 family RNA polymerase sigma factor [Muribaculaceae bacterium]